jgi:methylmalonyl-CoA decarboxylase subunit alpha
VRAASRLSYDDVVDPRELRNALLAGLDVTRGRDTVGRGPRGFGILP